MAGVARNIWLAAFLVAVLAVSTLVLPSAMWVCVVAVVLGLAGVVLFRGNGWRSGALLVAALAGGLALLDAFAGLLTPSPMGQGLVRTTNPRWWPPPDPVMGFRPLPNSQAESTATFAGQTVYHRTYHFDAAAARVTPPAPQAASTFLFVGDSFTFGQGLEDDRALAAQFATLAGDTVRAVNLGVPGYGPNHLVRMIESGLLDRYVDRNVKAVVTWIIPAQLARVTGDGSWLGSSPRYVLDHGQLHHTGTFTEHRLWDPVAGARYYLGQQFAFIDAIGRQQRQEEQIELFVALLQRFQKLVKDKFGAPLVIVYSWPDEQSRDDYSGSGHGLALLTGVIRRLRASGAPMLRVDDLTRGYPVDRLLIPHDGHPNEFTNALIAAELKRRLIGP